MRCLNQVLADQPYLAGEDFSMADITAFFGLGFVEFAQVPVPSDSANLKEWQTRVAERPNVAG